MITKQATPQIIQALRELVEVRIRLKESAFREEELTTTIKEYVENAAGAIKHNSTLLALIEEKFRGGIDTKLLRVLFPEAALACKKAPTPYLQVKCC